VYIPGGSKEPDALQAGQTPTTDTTPNIVVTDISGDNTNYCDGETDTNEEGADIASNVNKCLNQTEKEEDLGNNFVLCIVFPITIVHSDS
jgi:hypothetical protein